MRKRKDFFLHFPAHVHGHMQQVCPWELSTQESAFQNVFWDTLFILEKSSIGISETSTPHLSVQCHLTFSLFLSPEEKKKEDECTQKGQCF